MGNKMKNHPHEHMKHGEQRGDGPLPRLIAWELTRTCNLSCIHCRAASIDKPYPNELTTEECMNLLDEVASFASPIMILTGGEPLLRPDLFEIATYGTEKGLRMVLATNGLLIDTETTKKMREASIQRVSTMTNFARLPEPLPGLCEASISSRRLPLSSRSIPP
jgi:MoaA/NifB/PqqE/SkfB family radical SAM enzyme